jgi:Phosphate-selective porin
MPINILNTHLFIAAYTMCDTFLHQANNTNRTLYEHRYAVSGVLHVHAMQHYDNASQASLNTCIIYITRHRGLKYSGLTATREVGTTVGRNVNRSHKHTNIMYYFSKQKCKL